MPHDPTRKGSLADILTEDEYEVLTCLVAGESQRTISLRLGKGEAHALAVRESLMKKLGAKCTADAVREGIYAGL